MGVYPDPTDARSAVLSLREAGFPEDQIGVLTHDEEGRLGMTTMRAGERTHAGEGAAIGAAAGAGGGALWALGVAAGVLPVVGPIVAGGLLAAVFASAAGGAATGGIIGALVGLGVPDQEARYYEEEFRRGSTIVVACANGRSAEAFDILCDELPQAGQPVAPELGMYGARLDQNL